MLVECCTGRWEGVFNVITVTSSSELDDDEELDDVLDSDEESEDAEKDDEDDDELEEVDSESESLSELIVSITSSCFRFEPDEGNEAGNEREGYELGFEVSLTIVEVSCDEGFEVLSFRV